MGRKGGGSARVRLLSFMCHRTRIICPVEPKESKKKTFLFARIVGFLIASPFVYVAVRVFSTGRGFIRADREGTAAYLEGLVALLIGAFLVHQTLRNS